MLKAVLKLNTERVIDRIDDRLYSSFIEHMGRAVYTGIYEPEHQTADQDGFRQDTKELIRPLALSYIRYPGGNFVSGYHWRDGIGPKEKRPVRMELAWQAIETNQVGVDEFCAWCDSLGVKPMLAVNMGTGTPGDAAEMLEYCNVADGTTLSGERRANGYSAPHNVRLWCLGNEMDGPWQICHKTAEEYARAAHETAKMMKWIDPSIELVACGSSGAGMPTFGEWEKTVLRECWDSVDYLSLHSYYQNNDGDIMRFLAGDQEMSDFIDKVAGICAQIGEEKKSDKKIGLSFDEWNVWYHFAKENKAPEKWTSPRAIEEEAYNYGDALMVACLMTALINHADSVKIACIAQLVNVIAPITTIPGGGCFAQTIYWPFCLFSRYGRGMALKTDGDIPSYACKGHAAAPYLASSAVLSEDKKSLTLFFVNKSQEEEMRVSLKGISGKMTGWTLMSGFAPDARNTVESQPVVPCEREPVSLDEIMLEPASFHVIRVALA